MSHVTLAHVQLPTNEAKTMKTKTNNVAEKMLAALKTTRDSYATQKEVNKDNLKFLDDAIGKLTNQTDVNIMKETINTLTSRRGPSFFFRAPVGHGRLAHVLNEIISTGGNCNPVDTFKRLQDKIDLEYDAAGAYGYSL